jgi:hypothetical protein
MFKTISEIRGLRYNAIVSEEYDQSDGPFRTSFYVEPKQVADLLAT